MKSVRDLARAGFAAWPPDVRKGWAFPENAPYFSLEAPPPSPRRSLEEEEEEALVGKPQPDTFICRCTLSKSGALKRTQIECAHPGTVLAFRPEHMQL